MMMNTRTFVTMSAACMLTAALTATIAAQTPARGQDPKPMPPQSMKMAATDMDFINKAAHAGVKEADLAQLAIRTSKMPALVAAANKIKTDHDAANVELMALAKRKVHTPTALTAAEKTQAHGKIASLKGADFDKEWIAMMIKDHEDAIALFTSAASSADPDIAAYATKTLPALKEHLKTVQALVVIQ